MTLSVRFVGSGDSFGSGGRFQTCILVDGPRSRFAMDFGTSSLIPLAQPGIQPNTSDAISCTRDGEWTEDLAKIGRDADLLIAECYYYAKPVKWHLNYPALTEHMKDFGAKRVILTHMSREMLAHVDDVPAECARDGMVVE